jgi:glycerol-3-phosphate dehydrogenase
MPGSKLPFERQAMLDALRAGTDHEPFDVLVIGGGITGAGVALDAATRGLRTALVERDDFASGTSSKSSKMVHGGLRYLQNGDVRLVYEALHERRRLMRNAPHLVEILPFMIPILTKDGVVSKKVAKALGSAMWLYDLTGGWRIGKLHRRVSAQEAARHFPTTHLDKLSAGYVYFDAGADDARLTLTIARTAADHGAVIVNRCAVVGIRVDVAATEPAERVSSITVDADGERFDIAARCIVNAAGVWADDVRSLDEPERPGSIRPAKGVHITVPWDKIRVDIAVIIPVRSDKRSLFLVPWGARPDGTFTHVYVGTTDTDYDGPLGEPQCTADDIDYMLTALNEALDPSITEKVTRDDITATWAGLRPLVKESTATGDTTSKTTDLSRQHQVAVSDTGVVRVNGGKLTTYRAMAEDTVDLVATRLRAPRRARRSATRRLQLLGAGRPGSDGPPGTAEHHLAHRYGTMADEIRALIAFRSDLGEPLVPGQPYLRAEAVYAARHEMATTLEDILARRTRAHLFDRNASLAAAPAVAALVAEELGWSADEIERQVDAYRRLCADEENAGAERAHVANTTD